MSVHQASLALGALVLFAACSDPSTSTGAEPVRRNAAISPQEQLERAARFRSLDDDFADLAKEVPGFAGITRDEETFIVALVDRTQEQLARDVVGRFLHQRRYVRTGDPEPVFKFRTVQFDAAELLSWKRSISAASATYHFTALDFDEQANQVMVGVQTVEDSVQLARSVEIKAYPKGSIRVVRIPHGQNLATLRDSVTPRIGGLGWGFDTTIASGLLQNCTIGYNGWQSSPSQRVYVTASHCVPPRGVVTGGYATQGGVLIGTEISDPPYFIGPVGTCATGEYCRFSDAAIIEYNPGISATLGQIAFTGLPACTTTPCGLTIAGQMPITDEWWPTPLVGTYLSKTGQRTGWTRGQVTNTCADKTSDPDPSIGLAIPKMLCQWWVNAHADRGDSGSPVYERFTTVSGQPGWVTLHGVLWGRINNTYYFSPIPNVNGEVGSVITY